MGLVDKVLESFKKWVKYDVENFHHAKTEETRSRYRLASQQKKAAVEAHEQANAFLDANPTLPQER